MLSRVISRNFFRFCTTPATTASSKKALIQEKLSQIKAEHGAEVAQQISKFANQMHAEEQHFNSFIQDVKSQMRECIALNFEEGENGETPILRTQVGRNTWVLGEILLLGSGVKFLQLIVGFPGYGALAGTLGVAGIGAALSYSNYLKRSASQITSINLTADNKFHVYYLKPTNIISSAECDFVVDTKNFSWASFGDPILNWLRKCNKTQWVNIQGEYFWFNGHEEDLRVNSHVFHKLL